MRGLILLFGLLAILAAPARAAEDVAAAQTTIRSQMDALERDDAAAAYGYAASSIQTIFPQADAFLAMVRKSYPPIYRHRKFEFGKASMADDKIVQQVHIIDADGIPWEALYTLEPQPDGSLKISGCVLLKAAEQAV